MSRRLCDGNYRSEATMFEKSRPLCEEKNVPVAAAVVLLYQYTETQVSIDNSSTQRIERNVLSFQTSSKGKTKKIAFTKSKS